MVRYNHNLVSSYRTNRLESRICDENLAELLVIYPVFLIRLKQVKKFHFDEMERKMD